MGLGMFKKFSFIAVSIPGKRNIATDRESRTFHADDEWMLLQKDLQLALKLLKFGPNFDLFATQVNRQLSNYATYKLDPETKFINPFIIDWFGLKF